MNMLQNLKIVVLAVPEITGGTQKIWAVPGYAHAPFSLQPWVTWSRDHGYCRRGIFGGLVLLLYTVDRTQYDRPRYSSASSSLSIDSFPILFPIHI